MMTMKAAQSDSSRRAEMMCVLLSTISLVPGTVPGT